MCHTAVVKNKIAQATRPRTTATIIEDLRPMVSTDTPPMKGPKIELRLTREPIHEACSVSIGSHESGRLSCGRAGDVQLYKLPRENAPKFTATYKILIVPEAGTTFIKYNSL